VPLDFGASIGPSCQKPKGREETAPMTVKVLILEDNPVARTFLCRVVRESFSDQIVITEAGDLETARRHISLTGGAQGLHGVDPFKLVLVDLELPDGNGMELLVELTQYPATKIVTTLYSDDDHLFPALQCGADGYLLKLETPERLARALRDIVAGDPPLSPKIALRILREFRRPQQAAGPALTPRESETLTLVAKGLRLPELASRLGVTRSTAATYLKRIYRKLAINSRAEATLEAARLGLVEVGRSERA
jgi:DNA-binding NarL/FixJ family response regulator